MPGLSANRSTRSGGGLGEEPGLLGPLALVEVPADPGEESGSRRIVQVPLGPLEHERGQRRGQGFLRGAGRIERLHELARLSVGETALLQQGEGLLARLARRRVDDGPAQGEEFSRVLGRSWASFRNRSANCSVFGCFSAWIFRRSSAVLAWNAASWNAISAR